MFSKNIFSERLKALRAEKGVTLKELGAMFDTSKQTAQRWEAGIHMPDAESLAGLAEYFDVSVDYLMGRTDNPDINK